MWIWVLATVVAYFIKGLCGFANTIVFTSILGFGVNNVNISPVEVVLGYPSNIILIWKNRKNLKPKVYVPLALLVLAGSIPGAFLLKNVNAQYIKVVFGIVVIMIGTEMFFRENSKITFKESKIILGIIGILSGVLCGLFGIGALLAAYMGRVTQSSDEFKANLSAVFIVDSIFRTVLYCSVDVITLSSLRMSLTLMPFAIAGVFAGMKSSLVLDEKIVKKLVIILLILSGIVLVIKNI